MKTIREYIDLIESAQTSVTESGRWIVKYWDKQPENTPAEHEFGSEEQAKAFLDELPAHYVKALRQDQGVAEALSKNDLLNRLQKDLPRVDDPKNKDAEPVNWTGPKKGDYGHTGYQGHGMPTDRAEQARIRADKKKGLPEDEATAKMGLMSAMGSNDNNPADQRRAMAQQAVERLATKR